MTKYEWFNFYCMSRRGVELFLELICNYKWRKYMNLVNRIHNEKISLNRILYINVDTDWNKFIRLDYYSRRKKLYSKYIIL